MNPWSEETKIGPGGVNGATKANVLLFISLRISNNSIFSRSSSPLL